MKSDLMDLAFYKDYLINKRMVSDGTVHVYLDGVGMFLKDDPDIHSIEAYNDFIIKTAIKKRCYHYYYAIKSFIEFKIEDNSIKLRLLEGLLKPEMRSDIVQERRYLSEEQIIDVINSLEQDKHRIIALIQTLTGVRAGDILRLKRDNIVPEVYKSKNVLRLNITGKGRKRNVVYIHDEIAQQLILDYITNNYNFDDYYFIELGKNNKRRGDITSEFKLMRQNYARYWDDLKLSLQRNLIKREDFASHDFRRCFARRAWTKWKDIHVLQGLLNHAQPAVTLRYLNQSGLKNIDYSYEMQMGDQK